MTELDLAELCNHFGDAIVVGDERDRIEFVNATALRLLNWNERELTGQPLARLVPEPLREVGGRPFHRHLLERMEELDGRPIRAPVLRSDGVHILVDYKLSESPSDSGPGRLLVTMRRMHESLDLTQDDVEPRPKTSEAERTYHLVFENAPLGILHFDRHGVITACNQRFVEVIGSSKQVLIGLDMTTLHDEDIVRCVREATAGRRALYDGDYRSVTGNKVTPVRADFAPIFDESGEVSGGVGIVEDVTERRNAERTLARAERMASLGTLAAGVAHEINNPLSYVLTSIDVALRRLEAGEGPDREMLDSLRNAYEGTDRVRAIVRDLSTFARSSDERRSAVDVRSALESAIKLTANEIRHRAKLVEDFGEVPRVWAAESRLVQVFVNLLANAAQAIPEGDAADHVIRVVTRTEAGRAVVEVQDSGAGIPPEVQEHIFEPFWTDKPHGVGTGLGLAIVHGIVNALHGEITVQSRPGEGTTFRVTLPPSTAPDTETAGTAKQTPAAEAAADATTAARVLVIDDEERLARTLQMALQPPHEVAYVTTGNRALELLDGGETPDLILCDVMMPDVDGPDLYEHVVAQRPELAPRFVFMTGGAFTERTQEFLQKLDNPRLTKPFDVTDIEGLISEARRG